MLDPQQLIDILAEDAKRNLAEHYRAQVRGHEHITGLTSYRLAGARVALGRALAWRNGDEQEGAVSAFNRGRDFVDALPGAHDEMPPPIPTPHMDAVFARLVDTSRRRTT